MGCDTCKQKNEKVNQNNKKGETIDINFIPESIQNGEFNGSFVMKIVAFIVIIIALPLIILVLLGQMFLQFFLPKSLPKVSSKFKSFFVRIIKGYGKFIRAREIRKREKQFIKNRGYEKDSELIKDKDYVIEDTNFEDVDVFKK